MGKSITRQMPCEVSDTVLNKQQTAGQLVSVQKEGLTVPRWETKKRKTSSFLCQVRALLTISLKHFPMLQDATATLDANINKACCYANQFMDSARTYVFTA